MNTSGPQGTNIWPYSTQVVGCTSVTSADLQAVQGGLWATVTEYTNTQNGVAAGYGPTLQAENPPVYIFNTPSDYSSFFGSNCPKLDSGVFGETWITPTCSTTGNKSYTVVLLEATGSIQNQWLGLTAAHEMGHWYDETIMGTKSAPFSGTTLWNHVMNGSGSLGDYPNFNALVSACGTSAFIFNGLKDNHFPTHNYICANSGQGPGLSTLYSGYSTNTGVLVAAVPNYYSDPAELFAEEVAVGTGDVTTNPYVDQYIGHNGHFDSRAKRVEMESGSWAQSITLPGTVWLSCQLATWARRGIATWRRDFLSHASSLSL